MTLLKEDKNGVKCVIDGIEGISNDGGDPDDVNQNAKIEYEIK